MLDKPPPDAAVHPAPTVGSTASLAVLIVGMHRSGTSALAGMLNLLGVDVPGDLHPADEHNTRGYFEPRRIIDFHEALLAKLGSPSNDPLPLTYDWVRSPVGAAAAEELAELLDDEFAGRPMCLFKDPRMCRLAPVWTEALRIAGRAGVAILPCRHPLEVAGSLKAKGGLGRAYSLCLWLQHVLLGERFTRGMPRGFTLYDTLMSDWRGVAAKLEKDLGVAWPHDLVRAGPAIDGFLSGDLRHHRGAGETFEAHDPLEALCARAWTAVHQLERDPSDKAAMAEMDAISTAFDAALGVLAPLVVSYQRELDASRGELHETLLKIGDFGAGKDAEILRRDGDIASLQRRLIELDKARAVTRERLAKRESDLDWALRTLNEKEAAVGDLRGQLDHFTGVAHGALARAAAIENSTSWKLATALRKPLAAHPGARRLIRGGLKLGWWTLTFKLGRKLAERRAILAGQPLPAPEPQRVEAQPAATPASQAETAAPAPSAAPHVVFLSGEPTTPGHSYRIERYAEAARAVGATTAVLRREDVETGLGELAKADLLFIWRAHWDEPVERAVAAARAAGARVLFDVDDLLMEPDLAKAEIIDGIRSQRFTEAQTRHHFSLMEKTFMNADCCSAPTEFLAQRLRRHAHPAYVLPNGFDDAILTRARLAARRRRQAPDDGLLRIGYATGSKTHQKDFGAAAEAVAEVLRARPEARLVLFRSQWGDVLDVAEFPAFDGLLDQIEWRDMVPIQQLPDELARFDINLAPLEVGNIFCEAKSELKFFEAALAGAATVASPTGPFRKAMRHGETGFLANSVEEWRDGIERLAADPALRARMVVAAQLDALAEYGPERRAEAMASVLEQVLGRGRRAARAFELDLERAKRERPAGPRVPDHEVVFERDALRPSDATVVIPLYNYAGFVEEALDSVAAQTALDLDLIVVDDASTDDSLAVARRWIEGRQDRFNRVLLIRNVRNAGLAFTRNVAFANAETPFVLPLDADNRLEPTCVERLVAAIRESGAAFAYPQLAYFGDVEAHVRGMPYDPGLFVVANYIDAMALIRRSAWAAAGGYDHVRFGWEDYDFWCRLVELGMFGQLVAEPLAGYRVHGASMLRSETDTLRNKLQLVKDIERRHPWLHIDRDPPGGPSLPDE